MAEEVRLVKKGDLENVISGIITKEKQTKEDIEKVLSSVRDESLRKTLSQRLAASVNAITALEAGFVPIEEGWFWNTETKSKWQKTQVKAIVDTMPVEVKEAWERVKKLGLFKSFGVSGARRGDPVLVGKMGKQFFFIASWINFPHGLAVGFTARGKMA
jgi:hypothetical protein